MLAVRKLPDQRKQRRRRHGSPGWQQVRDAAVQAGQPATLDTLLAEGLLTTEEADDRRIATRQRHTDHVLTCSHVKRRAPISLHDS